MVDKGKDSASFSPIKDTNNVKNITHFMFRLAGWVCRNVAVWWIEIYWMYIMHSDTYIYILYLYVFWYHLINKQHHAFTTKEQTGNLIQHKQKE